MDGIERRPLPFRHEEKWGYIDIDGAILCDADFHYTGSFKEGFGYARQGTSLLILDEQFEISGSVKNVYSTSAFSCGLLQVSDADAGRAFYVDPHGNTVFDKKFESALPFRNDRAFAEVGGKWGMLDRAGRWVVEPTFHFALAFEPKSSVTSVMLAERGPWQLINREGDFVSSQRFDHLQAVSERLVPFGRRRADGRIVIGIADEKGREVVPPHFKECDNGFSQGLLGVETDDGTWGVIDRSGHWVIHPEYTYIGQCGNNLLLAYRGGRRNLSRGLLDGKFGFVTRDGAVAIEFQFDEASPFDGGVADVEWYRNVEGLNYDTELGYISIDGRLIWRERKIDPDKRP
jgi:hypothetical protein